MTSYGGKPLIACLQSDYPNPMSVVIILNVECINVCYACSLCAYDEKLRREMTEGYCEKEFPQGDN